MPIPLLENVHSGLRQAVRTLNDGYARSGKGREIIEVVMRGLARDPKSVPLLEHVVPLSAEANATVELLKVLPESGTDVQLVIQVP